VSRLRSASPKRWFRPEPSLPHVPTLARTLRKFRTKPPSVTRRAEQLLRVLALWAPAEAVPAALPPLLALAQLEWLRPIDQFRGGSLRELVDYVLRQVKYPLPEALYALLFTDRLYFSYGRDERLQAARLLAMLGRGGSLEDATSDRLLPVLSRKERHELWLAPPAPTLRALVIWARVRVHGGPTWLAQALTNTHLEPDTEMVRWFTERIGGLSPDDVGPVADWMRQEPRSKLGAWSAQRVLREARAWHELRTRPQGWQPGALPRSPFADSRWQDGESLWEITELRTGSALAEEGTALRHCVATYCATAMTGRISLWSMRCNGVRALTLEVFNVERALVQVRGMQNRRATESERAAVERWAQEQGVVVRPGAL
jgi:hypothetical protein